MKGINHAEQFKKDSRNLFRGSLEERRAQAQKYFGDQSRNLQGTAALKTRHLVA